MNIQLKKGLSEKIKIEKETGAFEKFHSELKNSIFQIVYILLKDQESSVYTTYCFAIIQCFQLLVIPFHNTV